MFHFSTMACCRRSVAFFIVILVAAVIGRKAAGLAVIVGGSSSSDASSSHRRLPSSFAAVQSIRQKGGITQVVSWNEPANSYIHDNSNNIDNDLSTLSSPSSSSLPTTTTTTTGVITRNKHQFSRFVSSKFQPLLSALRSTFLPVSYPNQIPSGYLWYAVWSWTQDWTTHLRAVLATHRVLQGVGVGRSDATALSALYHFMIRDGCGMIASLLFTATASYNFGTNVKLWRMFAEVMIDLGITLEVLATSISTTRRWLFLPMICAGNMCKAMCGVAAGACAGAIHLHWATPPPPPPIMMMTQNNNDSTSSSTTTAATAVSAPPPNIADIQAKFNAQHTVTATLGLFMAAWFAQTVSILPNWYLILLYSGLTSLHLFANIQCMRSIALTNLNPTRFEMVVDHFLEWWQWQKQASYNQPNDQHHHEQYDNEAYLPSLPTPFDIAKTEPLFFYQTPRRFDKQPKQQQQQHRYTSRKKRFSMPRIQLGIAFPDWWQTLMQQQTSLDASSTIMASTVNNNNHNNPTTTTTTDLLQLAKSQWQRQNYLLTATTATTSSSSGSSNSATSTTSTTKRQPGTVAIAFGQNVTARDMAKAYLEAHVLTWRQQQLQEQQQHQQQQKAQQPQYQSVPTNGGDGNIIYNNNAVPPSDDALSSSYQSLLEWEQSDEWQHMWQAFQASCAKAGWNLDSTQLPTIGYQIAWQQPEAQQAQQQQQPFVSIV